MNNSKIITIAQVHAVPGTVLVGGCFDVFHYGHLDFLKKSRAFGERLVVELESDEFIETHKKHTPFHTQMQRAEILAEMDCVDQVIVLPFFKTFEEYANLTNTLHPNVISVTEGDDQLENKTKQAAAVGAAVKIVPLIASLSSTKAHEHATITGDHHS